MTRERRTIPVVRESPGTGTECPLAPPAHATVYARTLHRACLVLGGILPLARHLQVTREEVRGWLVGDEVPPEAVFIAAVEVVLLHAEAAGPSN